MKRFWLNLLCLTCSKGATTAEYAMLLALVVIVLISTLSSLGEVLQDRLEDIIQSLDTA